MIESQRIANFFIDETRLSASFFAKTKDEEKILMSNFDSFITRRDLQSDDNDYIEDEIYLFQDV